MKTKIFAVALLLTTNQIFAQKETQKTVNSAGQFFEKNGTSVEWSIGEAVVWTLTPGSNFITQGVVQPNFEPDCLLSISLGADTLLTIGDSMLLKIELDGLTYQWSTGGTTAEILVKPFASTSFSVTATDATGCTASDTLKIEVTGLPPHDETDVITPDGDGMNDELVIEELEKDPNGYPDHEFMVFNRWGDRVFYTNDYPNNKWKGTNQSEQPLPQGTYYFILILDKTRGYPFQRVREVLVVR